MHVLLQQYRIRQGGVEEAARRASHSLRPRLRELPGFVAYYLVSSGENRVSSVAVYATPDGASAAERLLDDWFRADWPTFQAVPPLRASGRVLVHDAGEPRPAGEPLPDGAERRTRDRRAGPDRRVGADRRVAEPVQLVAGRT